jgi:uncharacterized protein YndB with AHSA1/START domain
MTTTRTSEVEITASPDVPTIQIIREFDAPPEKVFRAHADPELIAQWIGPRGMETRVEKFDCTRGGSYRYVTSGCGTDLKHAFYGSFHEVRPDELIVQTFTYEDVPDAVALERAVFEDLGDGRTRLIVTSLMDSFEGRDAMLASGMDVGIREGYEKLDELLGR